MAGNAPEVPRLEVTEPPEQRGLVLSPTEPEMIVGHSETADLILDDRYASMRHALISVAASGSVTVRDLNSAGGTFANGEQHTRPWVLCAGNLTQFASLGIDSTFE